MTIALQVLGCIALLALAAAFGLLALLATGGDSAFATRTNWVYAPLLVAWLLTGASMIAIALGRPTAIVLCVAAALAVYAGTYEFWDVGR